MTSFLPDMKFKISKLEWENYFRYEFTWLSCIFLFGNWTLSDFLGKTYENVCQLDLSQVPYLIFSGSDQKVNVTNLFMVNMKVSP